MTDDPPAWLLNDGRVAVRARCFDVASARTWIVVDAGRCSTSIAVGDEVAGRQLRPADVDPVLDELARLRAGVEVLVMRTHGQRLGTRPEPPEDGTHPGIPGSWVDADEALSLVDALLGPWRHVPTAQHAGAPGYPGVIAGPLNAAELADLRRRRDALFGTHDAGRRTDEDLDEPAAEVTR